MGLFFKINKVGNSNTLATNIEVMVQKYEWEVNQYLLEVGWILGHLLQQLDLAKPLLKLGTNLMDFIKNNSIVCSWYLISQFRENVLGSKRTKKESDNSLQGSYLTLFDLNKFYASK